MNIEDKIANNGELNKSNKRNSKVIDVRAKNCACVVAGAEVTDRIIGSEIKQQIWQDYRCFDDKIFEEVLKFTVVLVATASS